MYTYQKALLYSYPGLKTKIREYDSLIDYTASSSIFSSERCEDIAVKILSYIDYRNFLISLKDSLQKIISCFTIEEKKLFMKKYLGYKISFPNCSVRQYYRNQNKLLKNFSKVLQKNGMDENWFNESAKDIPYLKVVYNYVATHKTIPRRSIG